MTAHEQLEENYKGWTLRDLVSTVLNIGAVLEHHYDNVDYPRDLRMQRNRIVNLLEWRGYRPRRCAWLRG
jgi:hypothetical protein